MVVFTKLSASFYTWRKTKNSTKVFYWRRRWYHCIPQWLCQEFSQYHAVHGRQRQGANCCLILTLPIGNLERFLSGTQVVKKYGKKTKIKQVSSKLPFCLRLLFLTLLCTRFILWINLKDLRNTGEERIGNAFSGGSLLSSTLQIQVLMTAVTIYSLWPAQMYIASFLYADLSSSSDMKSLCLYCL